MARTQLCLLGCATAFVFVLGCSMPPGMNTACAWPDGYLSSDSEDEAPRQASQLESLTRSELRTLQRQILVAEELAMRYADSRGKLAADYLTRRAGCEFTLLEPMREAWGLSRDDVLRARADLDAWQFDPITHVPAFLVSLFVAVPVGFWVHRTFAERGRWAVGVTTVVASIALGCLVAVAGDVWGGLVAMARVGNTHMSYRAARIGWREYTEAALVVSAVLSALLIYGTGRWSRHESTE